MAKTDTLQATDSTDLPAGEDDDTLRKRLLSRIAVAGVVIVGLLGGLAVFDTLNKPQPPSMPKMADAPTAVETGKTAEDQKDEKRAEDKPEEAKIARVEEPAVPERTETPLAPPPLDRPEKSAKPATPPATARPAMVRPSPPVAAPAKPEAAQEIARVMPTQPIRKMPVHAPASLPLTQQAAVAGQRFLVQVGVFSNHANAEELAARLQQAGIPAQIESRVQVGPYASRAEADAARAKLKSLGIDDGMLVRR